MKYLFLYLTIVFSGLTLLAAYKFTIENEPKLFTTSYEVDIFRLSDKNRSRKLFSDQIEKLNNKRKEAELCQFWSTEFFKDQNRLTKESMDKYCVD